MQKSGELIAENPNLDEIFESLDIEFGLDLNIKISPKVELSYPQIELLQNIEALLSSAIDIFKLQPDILNDVNHPLRHKYEDGLRSPLREKNLFKGMGLHAVLHMIHKTNTLNNPEVHIGSALLLIKLMNSDIEIEVRKKLAMIAIYSIFPLIQYYEIPSLLKSLREVALKTLLPDLKEKIDELILFNLGFTEEDIRLDKLETLLEAAAKEVDNMQVNHKLARFKDPIGFMLKFSEGDDIRDYIASKIELDTSRLSESISDQDCIMLVVERLKSRGIVIDKVFNTFENPIGNDNDYKVLNMKVSIPSELVTDGLEIPYIPAEVRIALKNYDHTHTGYKVFVQLTPHISENKNNAVILARKLQSNMKGIEDSDIDQKVNILMERLDNNYIIFTEKANHGILIEKSSSLLQQLRKFSSTVLSAIETQSSYVLKRIVDGNYETYRIFIKNDEIQIFLQTDSGDKSINPNEFALKDCDTISRLNKAGDKESTLNDILNMIAASPTKENIPFELIQSKYINFDKTEILKVYNELLEMNSQLTDCEVLGLHKGDYEKLLEIQTRHRKLVDRLKKSLVKRLEIEAILRGDLELVSKHISRYRSFFLMISDEKTLSRISKLDNYFELIGLLFPLENFLQNNQLDLWVKYIQSSLDNKNYELYKVLTRKILELIFLDKLRKYEKHIQKLKSNLTSRPHLKEHFFNWILEFCFSKITMLKEFLHQLFENDAKLKSLFEDALSQFIEKPSLPPYKKAMVLHIKKVLKEGYSNSES